MFYMLAMFICWSCLCVSHVFTCYPRLCQPCSYMLVMFISQPCFMCWPCLHVSHVLCVSHVYMLTMFSMLAMFYMFNYDYMLAMFYVLAMFLWQPCLYVIHVLYVGHVYMLAMFYTLAMFMAQEEDERVSLLSMKLYFTLRSAIFPPNPKSSLSKVTLDSSLPKMTEVTQIKPRSFLPLCSLSFISLPCVFQKESSSLVELIPALGVVLSAQHLQRIPLMLPNHRSSLTTFQLSVLSLFLLNTYPKPLLKSSVCSLLPQSHHIRIPRLFSSWFLLQTIN